MEVVYSQMSPVITVLLIVNLLLVGLAWWNFRETRRLVRQAEAAISDFISGESEIKTAIALEKEKVATEIRKEFISHTHDEKGKVVV